MATKNKIKAFSLVELIVWITISMLLMVSIWVFVNSGMKNIFLQQKSLEFASNINDFSNTLYETFSNIQNSWSINQTSSWIIFKSKMDFSRWWFTYVWSSIINNYFCDDINSESTNSNHIFIKNFIPFYENSGDTNYLTWSVIHNWITYISHQKEHKITDSSWNTIVWKWVFWDFFEEWLSWNSVYLNNPTWIASDWEVIYISDTLNNRVLYLSWSTIHKLLDENDWLSEPTWLYYDSWNSALYISNSWLWEIWKITSDNSTAPSKTLSFSWITENNVSNFKIELYKNKVSYDITWIDTLTPWFNNITNDLKAFIWNTYTHTFMSWSTIEYKDFIWTNNYNIIINNPNIILSNWVYTLKLIIWNSERSFYYFTYWDEKIYTMEDNKIEVVRTWLSYPNGIWWNPWTNLFPNNWNLNIFDTGTISNLNPDLENDIILRNPIYNLDISIDDWNLLNIVLKHYKNYNCYNLDENKEKIWTFLLKTILK